MKVNLLKKKELKQLKLKPKKYHLKSKTAMRKLVKNAMNLNPKIYFTKRKMLRMDIKMFVKIVKKLL